MSTTATVNGMPSASNRSSNSMYSAAVYRW